MSDDTFDRDDLCFVCGQQNDGGLRLRPRSEEGRCVIEWVPASRYQGYAGVLHGGVISTLFDEAMAHAALSVAGPSPTAGISVEFVKPVAIGRPIRIEAAVKERRRRILRTEAELRQDGEVRARATGTFVAVRSADRRAGDAT